MTLGAPENLAHSLHARLGELLSKRALPIPSLMRRGMLDTHPERTEFGGLGVGKLGGGGENRPGRSESVHERQFVQHRLRDLRSC